MQQNVSRSTFPYKVCIMGLGYVGLPLYLVALSRGMQVTGVDIDREKIDALIGGHCPIEEQDIKYLWEQVYSADLSLSTMPKEADVYVICVPTPMSERHEAELSYVRRATFMLTPLLKSGDLIVVESTVPVGTTSSLHSDLMAIRPDIAELHMAFCPERILPNNILVELTGNPRTVGGIDSASTKKAVEFYRAVLPACDITPTDADSAELVKLVENSYRDMQIAFANEVDEICKKFYLSTDEVVGIANKHPRVNILESGIGVGGHCIPIDPWFLIKEFPSKLMLTARKVNVKRTRKTFRFIKEELELSRCSSVGILGYSYKKNCDDMRESPAISIIGMLMSAGYLVSTYDPFIDDLEKYKKAASCDRVYILVGHDQFYQEGGPRYDADLSRGPL